MTPPKPAMSNNPGTSGVWRRRARWLFAGAGIAIVWLAAAVLRPLAEVDSGAAGRFAFDWLRGMAAVGVGGLVFARVGRRGTEGGSGFPWVGAVVFVTLWWFPIALDSAGHRAVYFRGVLRWPAGMWAVGWLVMQAAVASRKDAAKWKTWAVEVLLVAAALGLPLAGLEAYYRWTLPTVAGAGDPYDRCTETWLALYDPNLNPQLDRVAPYSGLPRRFRDEPEPGPKAAGQQRVLFLGDSITYGWGVDREQDLMSHVTERLLQSRTGRDVLTGSVATFNVDTRQEHQLLRQFGLSWQPDVLVLVYDLSDITGEAGVVPSAELAQPGAILTWLIRRSFLVSRLYWTHAFRRGLGESHLDWLVRRYNDPEVWGRHREVLGGLFAECRERDIKVLLVLAPFLSAVEHYPEELRNVHRKLADFGREQGVSVLDGLDFFAGTRSLNWMVNRADRHPNAAAHRRYGERIAAALVPLLERARTDSDQPAQEAFDERSGKRSY